MASVKVFLKRARVFKDGSSPVQIEVIHRRRKYTKQLARVHPKDWDEKKLRVKHTKPHFVKINETIVEYMNSIETYLLDCQAKRIEPEPAYFFKRSPTTLSLSDALLRKAEAMKAQDKFRSGAKYQQVATKVKGAGIDGHISSITSRSLDDYRSHFKQQSLNTTAKDLECMRTVFNELRREALIDQSPFEHSPIRRQKVQKNKLTEAEFHIWCNSTPPNPRKVLARDMFACATMLRGMRAHDILTLRKEQIHGDRLVYTAHKTAKVFDMRIPEAALALINKYIGAEVHREYVFPLIELPFEMYQTNKREFEIHVNAKNVYLNKYTKLLAADLGIQKRVTMHIARHTFGYIADKRGVSVTAIQSLYGHSSLGMTETYIQELRESDELDKAVEGLF